MCPQKVHPVRFVPGYKVVSQSSPFQEMRASLDKNAIDTVIIATPTTSILYIVDSAGFYYDDVFLPRTIDHLLMHFIYKWPIMRLLHDMLLFGNILGRSILCEQNGWDRGRWELGLKGSHEG